MKKTVSSGLAKAIEEMIEAEIERRIRSRLEELLSAAVGTKAPKAPKPVRAQKRRFYVPVPVGAGRSRRPRRIRGKQIPLEVKKAFLERWIALPAGERRSFAVKAGYIPTEPYKWLKAVGMKLLKAA